MISHPGRPTKRSFQPVRERKAGKVALVGDLLPARLKELQLVEKTRELDLALDPLKGGYILNAHRQFLRQQRSGRRQQPRLLVRGQHDVDLSFAGDALEDLQVRQRVSRGVRTYVYFVNPPACPREAPRIGIENLYPVSAWTQAGHNLARSQTRSLGQQHTPAVHRAQSATPRPCRRQRVGRGDPHPLGVSAAAGLAGGEDRPHAPRARAAARDARACPALCGAEHAGPLGVPWRERPLSQAAVAVRATCLKGYHLEVTMREDVNPVLRAELAARRLANHGDRNRRVLPMGS